MSKTTTRKKFGAGIRSSGAGSGAGWGQNAQLAAQLVQRLTLASTAPDNPFVADATPFFDRCQDDIMYLHFGGRMGLLDMFGWEVTQDFLKELKYLTWVRPDHSGGPGGGTASAGHLSDPCADPNTFEFGAVDMTIQDFGRYGRKGPVREILHPTRFCSTDPRYRRDGTPVTDEREWDLAFAMDVLAQDLYRHVITGNATTAGQIDGLQRWIKTGYVSPMLDSMVIDWAGNDLDGDGGGSIELNGNAIADQSAHLVDVLLALYRRFRQRIMWSPQLAGQQRQVGDTVLVLPSHLAECLLDAYTCWSVCTGDDRDSFEARDFRNNLLGGQFGFGRIFLDGFEIPLLAYDWETMHGGTRGDIYFLNLRVGNMKLWHGEHLDAAAAAREMAGDGHGEYFSTDGGRVLGTSEVDNLCRTTKIWIRPRLYTRAPWLQARIMDVECERILDPLSPDPLESSFYPVTSFAPERQTVG